MTSYLAPESPRPFAVASENYFQNLNPFSAFSVPLDRNQPSSLCFFGEQYEKEFSFYLAKHAEVNCNDRICVITEQTCWATIIQERLFLIKPVHYIDSKLHQDVIEEKFGSEKFDRIILLNCLHQLSNPSPVQSEARSISETSLISSNARVLLFVNRLRDRLTNDGKILIIHREPNINTLPLPIEVIGNWYEADSHSARLIEQLHRDRKKNLELLWEVETIRFSIQKLIWFNLLIHRMFYPLTLSSQKQIADGLRQLNETYFKYHQGLVEMYDRLLFLTVQFNGETAISTKSDKTRTAVSVSSNTQKIHRGRSTPKSSTVSQLDPHETLNYKMLVTDEVTQLLNLKSNAEDKKRNLFKSSLDFM